MLALCLTSPVRAHDFWVQPNAYWVQPQAVTPLTIQVGHGPARQRSPIPLRRIVRFDAIGPNGARTDLRRLTAVFTEPFTPYDALWDTVKSRNGESP